MYPPHLNRLSGSENVPVRRLLQRNIVGIEARIDIIQGRFKMSQEMRPGDREGVVKDLLGWAARRLRESQFWSKNVACFMTRRNRELRRRVNISFLETHNKTEGSQVNPPPVVHFHSEKHVPHERDCILELEDGGHTQLYCISFIIVHIQVIQSHAPRM